MTDAPDTSEKERLAEDAQDGTDAEGPQETVAPESVPESAPDPALDPTAEPAPEEAGQEVAQESPEEPAQRVRELTADLQRLQAEYVNYKRRVDRDRDLVKQNARFSVLSAMLPVLDDIDRAREHEELAGGFKAVAESLERIVSAEGLVKYGKPGDEFDPRFHEALMHSLSPDVTTTTCDKVVQAGYQIGDRVVRPALVTVVDPDPSGGAPESGEAGSAPPTEQED